VGILISPFDTIKASPDILQDHLVFIGFLYRLDEIFESLQFMRHFRSPTGQLQGCFFDMLDMRRRHRTGREFPGWRRVGSRNLLSAGSDCPVPFIFHASRAKSRTAGTDNEMPEQ